MKLANEVTSLERYRRYALKAQILDDPDMMGWFADLCAGESPKAKVSEEMLALMEGHGLIRKTDFGWVLGAEGREFGRELGVVPGPSRLEIAPSMITREVPESETQPQESKNKGGFEKKANRRDEQLGIGQIWARFHETRDNHYRNLLMEHYRDLVKYCAERLHNKLPDKVELDDLVSAGIFGLMDAIDKFDPSVGVKFETYCSPRIRGSILDELRSMDWVSRLVRARAHQLDAAARRLEKLRGRKPTEKEIAEELDMNIQQFTRLQRDANAASLVSLRTKRSESETNIKRGRSKSGAIEAQKQDVKNLLTKGLTRAERIIIVLYYYEEMSMKEIGRALDISESRVSQMHSAIFARLKTQINKRKRKQEE